MGGGWARWDAATESPITSDTRVIISAYQIEKIGDDHPVYLALYGPKGLVIFDHPYNADYERSTVKTTAAP